MKEPEDCMAGAAREASALMGSGAAGGGGKGGEGGALRGAQAGGACRALASCSRRIWCCSCWSFRGSLGRQRSATRSEREPAGTCIWAARLSWEHNLPRLPAPHEAQATGLQGVACSGFWAKP